MKPRIVICLAVVLFLAEYACAQSKKTDKTEKVDVTLSQAEEYVKRIEERVKQNSSKKQFVETPAAKVFMETANLLINSQQFRVDVAGGELFKQIASEHDVTLDESKPTTTMRDYVVQVLFMYYADSDEAVQQSFKAADLSKEFLDNSTKIKEFLKSGGDKFLENYYAPSKTYFITIPAHYLKGVKIASEPTEAGVEIDNCKMLNSTNDIFFMSKANPHDISLSLARHEKYIEKSFNPGKTKSLTAKLVPQK